MKREGEGGETESWYGRGEKVRGRLDAVCPHVASMLVPLFSLSLRSSYHFPAPSVTFSSLQSQCRVPLPRRLSCIPRLECGGAGCFQGIADDLVIALWPLFAPVLSWTSPPFSLPECLSAGRLSVSPALKDNSGKRSAGRSLLFLHSNRDVVIVILHQLPVAGGQAMGLRFS